ncbi:enterochelin esterase [Methylocystis sp. 9N]|uniref:Enterochelin esterase n=1 Tax=Methylocystis borbori TaxID=3118750 RepID=A0ABU7XD47_9HYPH
MTTASLQFLQERFGNDLGSDRWWRRVAIEGTPIVSAVGRGRAQVVFLWRDPEGDETASATRQVYIDINSIADHHSAPTSLQRIEGTNVWRWSMEVESNWRGGYCFIPVDATRLPPAFDAAAPNAGATLRSWRLALLDHAQTDPLNPGAPHIDGRGLLRSAAHLPEAPAQPAWRDADRRKGARGDSNRLQRIEWESERLRNRRNIWIYATGPTLGATKQRPLILLLDGQYWAGGMPIFSALDHETQAGALPPSVYALIDSLDVETRARELPCHATFWEAVQEELLPQIAAAAPFAGDPRRTVVAGQSFGGLAALYAGLRWPERFGCALSQSGSFWWSDAYAQKSAAPPASAALDDKSEVIAALIGKTKSASAPLRIFMEAGSFEKIIRSANDRVHQALIATGRDARYRIYTGGHDPLCWRGGLLDGLSFLLAERRSTDGRGGTRDASALSFEASHIEE